MYGDYIKWRRKNITYEVTHTYNSVKSEFSISSALSLIFSIASRLSLEETGLSLGECGYSLWVSGYSVWGSGCSSTFDGLLWCLYGKLGNQLKAAT